ncbi:MAG: hypothetical protein ACWA5X_05735 [bacterium]
MTSSVPNFGSAGATNLSNPVDGTNGLTQAGVATWDQPVDSCTFYVYVSSNKGKQGHYQPQVFFEITAITGAPVLDSGLSFPADSVKQHSSLISVTGIAGDTVTMADIAAASGLVTEVATGVIETEAAIQVLAPVVFESSNEVVHWKNGSQPYFNCEARYGVVGNVDSLSTHIFSSPSKWAYAHVVHGGTGTKLNQARMEYRSTQGGYAPTGTLGVQVQNFSIYHPSSLATHADAVLTNIETVGGRFEPLLGATAKLKQTAATNLATSSATSYEVVPDNNGNDLSIYRWDCESSGYLHRFWNPSANGWDAFTGKYVYVDSASAGDFYRSSAATTIEAFSANSVSTEVSHSATGILGDIPVSGRAGEQLTEKELTLSAVSNSGFSISAQDTAWGYRKIVVLSGAAKGQEYYLTKTSGVGGDFTIDREWDVTPVIGDRVGVVPVVLTHQHSYTGDVNNWDVTQLPSTTLRLFSEGMLPIELELLLKDSYSLPINFSSDTVWQSISGSAALAVSGIAVDRSGAVPRIIITQSNTANGYVTIGQLHDFIRADEALHPTQPLIVVSASTVELVLNAELELRGATGAVLTGTESITVLGTLGQRTNDGSSANIFVIADVPITDQNGTSSILHIKNVSVPTEVTILVNDALIIHDTINSDTPYMLSSEASGAEVKVFVGPQGRATKRDSGIADGTVRIINASEVEGMDKMGVAEAMAMAITDGIPIEEGSALAKLEATLKTDQWVADR